METLIKLGIVVAAIAALFAVKDLYDKHQQGIGATAQLKVDQKEMDRIKSEAATKLAALQAAKETADKALSDFKNTMDVKYVQSQKQLAVLSANLRDLGQLRDPYAKTSGCGGGSGGTETKTATASAVGVDNRTQAGGLLSTELTGFLRQKDADADAINVAYSDCRGMLVNLQTSPAFSQ